MNSYLSVIFSICLLVAFCEAARDKKADKGGIKCDEKALEKADLCGEKLFFVGKNARLFPSSEPEAEKYCSQTQTLVTCVKKFTDRCASNDLQRQLANVMLYTVRSHHKGVCGSKQKRGQLMTMSKCANTIRKKSTECMNKMLIQYGEAIGLEDNKYRIPYACCAFHKMRQCITGAAEKAGKDVCSAKAMDIFEQYIGSMAGNTLELMCAEYDADSDKCASIKKLKVDAKRAKTPKSLMTAFGDLLLGDHLGPK